MKKNTIKAFTLVGMLIVIVIIGILIASLMPRMQTAQGRARDVARKNDLSQIQTAIITSQSDRKVWPGMPETSTDLSGANAGLPISSIQGDLIDAWMSSIPTDPNGSNINFWLWQTYKAANKTPGTDANVWQYLYVVARRNWVKNAWFALMAKTEVEWSSNWVVCTDEVSADDKSNDDSKRFKNWWITNWNDLAKIQLCKSVREAKWSETCTTNTEECIYTTTSQLRYILVY